MAGLPNPVPSSAASSSNRRFSTRNVLMREVFSSLSTTSLAIKLITLTLVLFYALSFNSDLVTAISVTPGYFWPPHFWIWTAFTHCFLEVHFWEVLIDVAIIVLVGKLLEPLWGAIEMVVFFAVVNVGVALLSSVFYYILYMITFNTELLFDVHIHGLAGYLAGVTVAVKQVMPDHILYRSPVGKITNRNIPLAVFALSFILWAIGMVEGSYCTMFGSGMMVSWIYLRFYQVHGNGSKGDLADSFAFATFFPNVLQPPIAIICNTIFSLLVKIRVCKKPVRKYDMGSASSSISISLPGVETHDTERRRQIALKALSERLNKSESTGGKGPATSQDWPSLDGDDESKPVASSTTSPSSPRPAPAIATVEATEVVVVGEQKAEEAQPLL